MNKLREVLSKRSSITCIAREQYGKVEIEYYDADRQAMEDFVGHLNRCIQGMYTWAPPAAGTSGNEVVYEREKRRFNNFLQLIEIAVDLPLPRPELIKLEPVNEEEGSHFEWRYRLRWEFTSANKAEELFSRLLWLLEA